MWLLEKIFKRFYQKAWNHGFVDALNILIQVTEEGGVITKDDLIKVIEDTKKKEK